MPQYAEPIGPTHRGDKTRGRGKLTDAGWPRPFIHAEPDIESRAGILPVAWITPEHRWAEMDPMRGRETVATKSCQVCGEGHGEDPEAIVVVFVGGKLVVDDREVDEGYDGPTVEQVLDEIGDLPWGQANKRGILLPALDNSIMHDRCARLAVHFCPLLRRKKTDGVLFPFGGPQRAIIGRENPNKAITYTAEQRDTATFALPEFETSLYLEGAHAHNVTL